MNYAEHHEPPAEALDLIRACLATREQPRLEAWATSGEFAGVLRQPVVKRAGLMPQLLHAAQLAGVELEAGLQSACRAARFHEELRLAAVAAACRDALTEAPAQAIVLRGVALGHTVYDHPALRHCHDLDLLVASEPGSTSHRTGFPISRHVSLFERAGVEVSWADVAPDSVWAEVAGVPTRVLDPADALVHVCAHASGAGQPHSLLWTIDAALLIDRFSTLDWDRVVERAGAWQVASEVYYGLAFLDRRLDVAVPDRARRALAPPLPRARRRVRKERRRAQLIVGRVRMSPRTRLLKRPARLGLRVLRTLVR